MQPRARRRRTSDLPPDLAEEREEFLRTFLAKGARFTEELIAEHHALRARANELEVENAKLRTQLASNDAIRDLLRTIETLERERNTLLDKIDETDAARTDFEHRYGEIEAQFNDLATLYVAAFQLHSTLRLDRVARHLNELLLQFVGAERFALFLLDEHGERLRPAVAEGIDVAALADVVPGEGPVGEAFLTGIVSMHPGDPADDPGAMGAPRGGQPIPMACIPLRLDHEGLGVLAIYGLLAQKRDFTRLDRELFTMLQSHAATALVAANLHARNPDFALTGLAAGSWPRTRLERTATGSLIPPSLTPSRPPPAPSRPSESSDEGE